MWSTYHTLDRLRSDGGELLSLGTALGDRMHARRDVLDILRVDARHREAAVARAEDVVLRRERVHLLRVRLQLYAPCSG